MKKSSNIDSPFYRLMGKIGDLIGLNLLWLLCCVPVVTAGASTVGLFTVTGKLAAGEEYQVKDDFFKAFKRDFRQSTAVWLVVLAAGFAARVGLKAAAAQDNAFTGILAAASFLLGLGIACCGCWGFALLARFTYPKALLALTDGGRMTIANLLPTVGILAFLVWMSLLWKLAPGWFIYLLIPIFLIGGSASALGMSVLMRSAFARLEKAGRKPEEETESEICAESK